MPAATDAVWIDVLPSMKGFGPALAQGAGAEADKVGKDTGGRFGKSMLMGIAVVAGGAALASKALYNIGKTFDDVSDTIRVGTGATGQALDALTQSAKNVGQNVPADFEAIGTTIADLNTRLGLTGKPLEDMSAQFLELSRITGTDVAANIENVSRVFGDWGVATEDQAGSLDYLFKVSQSTGIGMDELSQKVVQYGAPMRQFGFSFEESAALMGKWAKEGVNTETIMGGLRAGLGKLAKSGKDPAVAFQEITAQIKNAGSEGEATAIAIETFGQRAGPDLAAAVREGRFELDDLMGSLGESGESIMAAGKDTQDFSEKWLMFKNQVLVVLEPIATRVFGGLATAMELVTQGVTAFANAWKYNDGEITSSGINGFLEQMGYVARQVFDYIGGTVIPTLRDFGGWVQRNADIILPFIAALGAGYVVFQTIAAITRTWAAAQAILNAVMAANPIGLVIVVIAALVAGLVVAYQRSETFRQIVDAAFRAVAAAASWMWDNVLKPAFAALQVAWSAVATGVAWAWENVIKPAWSAVSAFAQTMWNNVLKPVFGFIWDLWSTVANAIFEIWRGVILVAWTALSEYVKFMWNNVLSPTFSAIRAGWDVLAGALKWAYDNVIQPVWNAFKTGVEGLQKVFETVTGAIGRIWDGLIEAVKKPIRIVFEWVNGNMISPINSLLGVFPGDLKIPPLPKLASGGVVRGPGTGTSDSILGIDPRSGLPTAWVSNGEMVVNAEATRRNRALLEAINSGTIANYRRGGEIGAPSLGDIWNGAKAGAQWLGGKAMDAAGWVADMAVKGARVVAAGVLNPLRDAAKRLTPDNVIGNTLDGVIDRLVNAVLGKSDEQDAAQKAGMGGGSFGALGSGPAGSSWASLWLKVKAAFPQARMTSNYRPGDPGYHGKGKALDVAGPRPGDAATMGAINRWAAATMGANLSQLIYTPGVNLLNGRPHTYNAATRADHYDHVHMATYDQGGLWPSGTAGFNLTGGVERVLTPRQDDYFRRFVDSSNRSVEQSTEINVTANFTERDIAAAIDTKLRQREALLSSW